MLPREHLKALIERSGLSQAEIARRMGFASTAGLNRYVRHETQGDRPISAKVVLQLADILVGHGPKWRPIALSDFFALIEPPKRGEPKVCPLCQRGD